MPHLIWCNSFVTSEGGSLNYKEKYTEEELVYSVSKKVPMKETIYEFLERNKPVRECKISGCSKPECFSWNSGKAGHWHRRAYCRSHETLKQNGTGKYGPQKSLNLLASQRGKCAMCRIAISFGLPINNPNCGTIDQIIPSGGYIEGNVIALCYRCNSRKNDHTLESARKLYEFLLRLTQQKLRKSPA